MFILNEIRPGGAEMFVIRLAHYMQDDFNIYVYSCFPKNDAPEFVAQFHEAVNFESFPHPNGILPSWREFLYWKLNALANMLGKKGLYTKLRALERKWHFSKELRKRNIRVVNSSATHSDNFAVNYIKRHFHIPAVVAMHSAYNREHWGVAPNDADFFRTTHSIFNGADALLYTADHNIEIMHHMPPLDRVILVEKVYLGYEPKVVVAKRSDLGWPDDAFVVTMMARGIAEKGWEQALHAFCVLLESHANSLLVLIHTDTEHMDSLKEQYALEGRIRFMGYVADPSAILKHSDCSILPTHYPDSLPYAITESLAYGTPVFATPVAEIPQMLETEEGLAGGLIPFTAEGVANADVLATYMAKAASDKVHLELLRHRAKLAFRKFSMTQCGGRYMEVFKQLIDGKA